MIARPTDMRLLVRLSLALVALATLVACSHYRLGTSARPTFTRLYVAPAANQVDIPQAAAVFSTALREAFLRDTRLTLVNTPAEAEATLHITLSRYNRGATTARGEDTGLARKFDLNLEANCSLRDTRTGTLLIDHRPLTASRQIYTTASPSTLTSDQQQAEFTTLPLLARELADRVAHQLLDVW